MATSTEEPAPTTEPAMAFPYWPFVCLAFYRRVAGDLERCAQMLAHAQDVEAAVEVQEFFSVTLFRNLLRGYLDLTLYPLTAMAEVMTACCERGIAQYQRRAAEKMAEPPNTAAAGEPNLRVILGRQPRDCDRTG